MWYDGYKIERQAWFDTVFKTKRFIIKALHCGFRFEFHHVVLLYFRKFMVTEQKKIKHKVDLLVAEVDTAGHIAAIMATRDGIS